MREAEIARVEFEKAQMQVESVGVRAAIASAEEDIAGVDLEVADKENLLDQASSRTGVLRDPFLC